MANATVELNVGGMTCDGCVRAIERKLSKVAGVESARVDLAAGKAQVQYDDSLAGADQFIAAIEQIGYRAGRT